jgi:hypothetical protein
VSLPVAAFDAAFSISSVAAALLAGCFLRASLKLRGAHTKMFSTFSVQFRLNLPPQFEFFRGAGASFFHHASHSHGFYERQSGSAGLHYGFLCNRLLRLPALKKSLNNKKNLFSGPHTVAHPFSLLLGTLLKLRISKSKPVTRNGQGCDIFALRVSISVSWKAHLPLIIMIMHSIAQLQA